MRSIVVIELYRSLTILSSPNPFISSILFIWLLGVESFTVIDRQNTATSKRDTELALYMFVAVAAGC